MLTRDELLVLAKLAAATPEQEKLAQGWFSRWRQARAARQAAQATRATASRATGTAAQVERGRAAQAEAARQQELLEQMGAQWSTPLSQIQQPLSPGQRLWRRLNEPVFRRKSPPPPAQAAPPPPAQAAPPPPAQAAPPPPAQAAPPPPAQAAPPPPAQAATEGPVKGTIPMGWVVGTPALIGAGVGAATADPGEAALGAMRGGLVGLGVGGGAAIGARGAIRRTNALAKAIDRARTTGNTARLERLTGGFERLRANPKMRRSLAYGGIGAGAGLGAGYLAQRMLLPPQPAPAQAVGYNYDPATLAYYQQAGYL